MVIRRAIVWAGVMMGMAGAAPGAGPESINLRHTVTVEVVQRTKDAIVYISTSSVRQVRRRIGPEFFWDPLGQMGAGQQVVQVPVNSLGSGFIVHPDGYVVTNNHVIDRAREITVELTDGRKLPAELVSSDPDADLAILKVKSDKPFPVLDLGDSSNLMIGEPAIAIGNPLGFSHSVSTGIVSAIHRDLKDENGSASTQLRDLIQTDAAINPGNSGGPLLNAYGQVIGINTAIRGDAQNIGFAIPINKLRDMVPDLMNPSQVNKVQVSFKLKETRDLSAPSTVRPHVILEGKTPRTIDTIDGEKVVNIIDAYAALLRIKPAQKQTTVKFSDGSEERFALTQVPLPDAIVQARKQLGITVEQLTPMLAEKYGLRAEQGLLITEVKRDSVAAKAGLEGGDVLVRLGRYPINTLDDLAKLLPHVPKAGRVSVGVLRGDQVGNGFLQF